MIPTKESFHGKVTTIYGGSMTDIVAYMVV
jgi:hypothetical protein